MLAVSMTVTNRPQYLKPVLDSWVAADWPEAPLTYLFNLEPTTRKDENIRLIHGSGLKWEMYTNKSIEGPLTNPWLAFQRGFAVIKRQQDGLVHSDFVICAEDDSLVSPDVLDYFMWASGKFAGEEDILAICSFNDASCEDEALYRAYPTKWFYPTIWGTWYDRWTELLRDTWDHDYTSGPIPGVEAGWDWNIRLRVMPAHSMYNIVPACSRSQHIGRLGGAHTTEATFPGSVSPSFVTAERLARMGAKSSFYL